MKHLKHRWTPLLLAAVFLAGCSGSDADEPKADSETNSDDDAVMSEDNWDSERERLEKLDLPVHEVAIDGENTYSESNQEQWDLFNGGDVTREAYEEAFLNFAACVEDDHGWINYLDLDEEIINYTMTATSDPDDYCYLTHFELVAGGWQDLNPPDETDLIEFLIECLKDEGIEPAHEEPTSELGLPQEYQLSDLWEQEEENNINCGYIDPSFDELHEAE